MPQVKLSSLTIFFPFFNDRETVDSMIDQAYFFGGKLTENLEVIAIHGGASHDNTLEAILQAKVRHSDLIVLDHSCNKEGYGVIRHGFQAASKEWVFYTDGDGQYHLKDLQRLVKEEFKYSSDVVNGYKVQRSDPRHRIILGKGYQLFTRFLFHLPIRDVDCDFRLIRKKFLNDMQFISKGSSILPELILHLKQAGAKFSEIPIEHYPRIYGRSNYSPFQLLYEKITGDLRLFIRKPSPHLSESRTFQMMRKTEETLWWYVTLREQIYREIIIKAPLGQICDIGCGTGCNLQFLQKKNLNIEGIDLSSTALNYCKDRGLTKIQQGSITKLPTANSSYDLVLVIDVLCMLEENEIIEAIGELKRVLKPAGSLILNEPAFHWLRSQHDLSCQMKRRFNRKRLTSLLSNNGFEMEKVSYRVCFLFPLIALVRIIKKCAMNLHPTSDLKMPPSFINWLLEKVQGFENRLIERGYRMPFGSSIFIIARRS